MKTNSTNTDKLQKCNWRFFRLNKKPNHRSFNKQVYNITIHKKFCKLDKLLGAYRMKV